MPLFRFSQIEVPWRLGPPDGRYLVKTWGYGPDSEPTHVLVLKTEGALKRGRLSRSKRDAAPEPEPARVPVCRATVISAGQPLADLEAGKRWLADAGEDDLADDLQALDRVLHAFRVVTANPQVRTLARAELLVARIGYGDGEEVAYGKWTDARELTLRESHRRRAKVLEPQARLAQVLGQRVPILVCEELVLRARLDWDSERERPAALQLKLAYEAGLAELGPDDAHDMQTRIDELTELWPGVERAARSALTGRLSDDEREIFDHALYRLEAALRARAVALA
jgi:hypothetical protein